MKCAEGRIAKSLHSKFLDISHFLIFIKLHDLNKFVQCQSVFFLLKQFKIPLTNVPEKSMRKFV